MNERSDDSCYGCQQNDCFVWEAVAVVGWRVVVVFDAMVLTFVVVVACFVVALNVVVQRNDHHV